MERDTVRVFWISLVRGSLVPAFSSAADLPRVATALSNRDPAPPDSIPDSGRNSLRRDFGDFAQEKDSGDDGNAVGHRRDGFGRIERPD